jgi:pimeloyl-ACP methyl ester carboxylesterase
MQAAANKAEPVDAWWDAGGNVPILVLQGLQDTIAPPENGRLMKAESPDRVELVELDGVGHAMLPEQPEAIASAVIGFLKRTCGIA